MPGLDDVPFLTNSSMMDVDFIPEHLVIVGGSYIGLEFGQMFRRFGSEVTIVEMGDRADSAARTRTCQRPSSRSSQGEGINVRLNAKCISLSRQGDEHRRAGRLHGRSAGSHAARTCCSPSAAGRTPTISASSAAGVTRRQARLHRRRRRAANERAGHLGARRLQRPGRVHAHLVQRRRDRRRQPARERYPPA